ncbi:efflux RND transporter periplasmic adaptor subunit [Allorhizobium sp. BGMRC 0089]|uniref:efflux RND transporter periplasmic adaptor subunit n=1 Tax=Allorhizobium sonneratiae TaxID=2934936 RepID=UPI0020334A62|nr:efflux RND transporter periplasmic adaptor subunit [Allorhizobium sonneratiae]MCM2292669.1 efflux RND transporter periplasmic adaptor subunit [Allorhizobium sonneratiae]
MIKRMIIMLLATGAVLGGLFWFQNFKAGIIQKVMASMSNPPQTVSTTVANVTNWQDQIQAVGTLGAERGADLALQVSGIVQNISFKNGDDVKEGQTLLQLYADDDIAKLQSLQATADNYAITLKRDQEQFKYNGVSQATVDTDKANLKNATALVDQQAAVLSEKTLKAPYSGRLGIRAVDVGEYLTAGTTIVTLQALDLLHVDIYLPQQRISELKVGQPVKLTVDAFPGKTFDGEISAINSKVDSTSRNVQVRAVLKNPEKLLLPGMFARVTISIGNEKQFITLPQTAIVYNPYGDSVFVVENTSGTEKGQKTVKQVFVKTGDTRGDNVAITSGINKGDTVVVAGQLKLRNGTPVMIDNSHVPTAENAPQIVDQ